MNLDEIMYKPVDTSTTTKGKNSNQLDMSDFLNLLVAQMTNQDMMNPVNDTEFIAQMAQFASLQGIQTLQEYEQQSYAASYAGKYVTVAEVDGFGKMETISGKVEAVTFYDGQPKVVVDGKAYDLYKVMEVSDAAGSGSLADASRYVNKRVTVQWKDEFGETNTLSGLVTSVTLKDNVPQVIIEGKEYPVSWITAMDQESGTGGEGSESGSGAEKQTSKTTAANTETTGKDKDGVAYHRAIAAYANTTMAVDKAPTAENSPEYIVAWAKSVAASAKYSQTANSWQTIAQSYFKDFGLL